MAQALVRFLDNQYIDVDGSEIKFVKGIFASFWPRERRRIGASAGRGLWPT